MASQIFIKDFPGLESPQTIYLHTDTAPGIGDLAFVTLQRGNYALQARPNDDRVTETFMLSAEGSEETLRTMDYALRRKLEFARLFHSDPFSTRSVWLAQQTSDEDERNFLIYDYALDVLTDGLANPMFNHGQGRWLLTITRSTWAELVDPIPTITKEDLSASGGVWDTFFDLLPGFAYRGDMDGRISTMSFNYSVNQLARLYIGIRPARDDSYEDSEYVGWVECEDGIAGQDTSVEDPSSSPAASGNKAMITTFATNTNMIGRLAVSASDFSGEASVYVGRYKVLVRAALSEAGEVGLRMQVRYGSATNTSAQWQPYQYFAYEHANYTLIEMGEVTLPPHPYRNQAAVLDLADFHIVFQAEKLSGAGTLRLRWDAVALIPAEHYARLDIKDPTTVPTTSFLKLFTDEDGKSWAAIVDGDDVITQSVEPELSNWVYPMRQGTVVIAALEGATRIHSLSRTGDLSMQIFQRYRTYSNMETA